MAKTKITVQYEITMTRRGEMTTDIRERTFASQAALERWAELNSGNAKILRYLSDRSQTAEATPAAGTTRVTIEISEEDYREMIQQIARNGDIRPQVGVIRVLDAASKASLKNEQDFLKAEPRSQTVGALDAARIANKTFDDAYSAERYGRNEWAKAAIFLAGHGFTADEIESILLSKWMRWAADAASATQGKASHLRAYVRAMHGDEFAEAARMAKEGK